MKTDAQLLLDIKELEKKFLLLGFKGNLIDVLNDLISSKLNKGDEVKFDGNYFSGEGTIESPLTIKFPPNDNTALETRIKALEDYIQLLKDNM